MKILHKYILRQTLVTLIMTVGVFTFVLMTGRMMRQLSDLLVHRQLGLHVIGMFVLLALPYMLSFALPMALLATVLLTFGRLSADHEITAMRASGVGLGQIVAPVILLAAVASGVCLYINASLAPQCLFQFKTASVQFGVERPLDLLDEGRYMKDFPGYVIYVGRKTKEIIEDVVVYSLDDNGNVISSLRAKRGTVSAHPATNTLLLDLQDVRGDLRDPKDPTNLRKIRAGTTAQRYPVELDLGRIFRKARAAKKLGEYGLSELAEEIRNLQARGIYPSAALVEAHRRASTAIACISFALIGIPLGMKTSRRETTVGIAISLGLAFAFYFVIIVADAVKDRPSLFPEAILWSPHLIFEVLGLALLWRLARA